MITNIHLPITRESTESEFPNVLFTLFVPDEFILLSLSNGFLLECNLTTKQITKINLNETTTIVRMCTLR